MPLYTYQCNNCGVHFERVQKFTDQPIKRCPECNKSAVKRVIQPAGIIFKGSGWYKTDSRTSTTHTGTSTGKSKKSESKSSESSTSGASSSSAEE